MNYRLPLHITHAAWIVPAATGDGWHLKKIKDASADLHTELDLEHPPLPTQEEARAYAASQGLRLCPRSEVIEAIAQLRQAINRLDYDIAQITQGTAYDRQLVHRLTQELTAAFEPMGDSPTHSLTLHYAGGTHIHTEKRTLTSILSTIAASLHSTAIAAVITREEYATSVIFHAGKATPATGQKLPAWPKPSQAAPAATIASQN